jgi:hypothetical protein
MDTQAIVTVFVSAAGLTIVSFWQHHRFAGTEGRPGALSMGAFVLGWLAVLTTVITGTFLLMIAVTRLVR